LVSEEFERQRTSRARRNVPSLSKQWEADEAMAVNMPSVKQKGHGSSRPRKPPVCWNCGETGHIRPKCPHPKKDKGSTTSETAHLAVDLDDEAFGVSDNDSIPNLQSVSDSDISTDTDSMPGLKPVSVSGSSDSICADELEGECEGEDWFSEIGEDLDGPWGEGWDTEELSDVPEPYFPLP